MNIQERIFKDWTIDDIRLDLNIKQKRKCKILDKWLVAKGKLNEKRSG